MDRYEEIQKLMATIEDTKYKVDKLKSFENCYSLERFQKMHYLVVDCEDLVKMYQGLFSKALEEEKLKLEVLMSQFTKLVK